MSEVLLNTNPDIFQKAFYKSTTDLRNNPKKIRLFRKSVVLNNKYNEKALIRSFQI